MLHSLTLKNFRCFHDFILEPLERINLIAGKNNVGKTSLLEAIFIFINPTNADSLFQVNRLRGILTRGGRFEDTEEVRGFFLDQEIDKVIEIRSVGENHLQRSLKIYLAEPEDTQPSLFENATNFHPNESLTTEVKLFGEAVKAGYLP